MKIRVTLVIDLDEGQWVRWNGLESKTEVREDVRTHILTMVQSSVLLEEAEATVALA